MKFAAAKLEGVFVIEPEPIEDERGFFALSWLPEEYAGRGLNPRPAQCNISFNWLKGTLRGMHFQAAPHEEAKSVRCTRGAIFDVVVDLRPDSPTRCRWSAVELTAENRRMLYVPEGFAHGYQTLEDATEVFIKFRRLTTRNLRAGFAGTTRALISPGLFPSRASRRGTPGTVSSKAEASPTQPEDMPGAETSPDARR